MDLKLNLVVCHVLSLIKINSHGLCLYVVSCYLYMKDTVYVEYLCHNDSILRAFYDYLCQKPFGNLKTLDMWNYFYQKIFLVIVISACFVECRGLKPNCYLYKHLLCSRK